MALDFPPPTTVGQVYAPVGVSKSWIWTGEQWSAVTAPIEEGASVTVSEAAPSGASAGDLWFDSSSGVTSVYYDGTWVDVGGGDSGTSAGSVNGIVKSDGAGNFSAAVAGTDFLAPGSLGSAIKAWVTFTKEDYPSETITIHKAYNVSSVGFSSANLSKYTITLSQPRSSTSYGIIVSVDNQNVTAWQGDYSPQANPVTTSTLNVFYYPQNEANVGSILVTVAVLD